MGDQRSQSVVVAEADLVVGDRIVLVDDGNDPEVEEEGERLASVEVLLAVDEVEGGQKDLAADEPCGQRPVVVADEVALGPTAETAWSTAGSVGCLRHAEQRQAGRDSAARHDHDPVAALRTAATSEQSLSMAPWTDLPRSSVSDDVPILATTRRPGAREQSPDHGIPAEVGPLRSASYSNSKPPMRTRSPGRAPARDSA